MAESVIDWLLEGDPAIRWQAGAALLRWSEPQVARERSRVAREGWGGRLLDLQDEAGTWGGGLYTPKWTSTTYTCLLLRRMGLLTGHAAPSRAVGLLLDAGLAADGGINLWRTRKESETCVTGMVLSIAATYRPEDERTANLLDYLLREQLCDGGWNCQAYRGATHSSFHTTISVLEALLDYAGARDGPATEASQRGREFLLRHRLYRSHRTGNVADSAFTRFSFPPRWYYDVLRALDHFQAAQAERDDRLDDPVALVERRRGDDGRWLLQNPHRGRTFFDLEQPRAPSRWNTLRALRVLAWWGRS